MEFTVAQTLTTARQRADVENSPHFSDSEMLLMFNTSKAVLHSKKVMLGEDQETRERTLYTAPGVEEYSIGANFLKLVSVDIKSDNERWIQAERWNWLDRHSYIDQNTGWHSGRPVAYRMVGSRIRFLPVPEGIYQVAIFYVVAPEEATLTSEIFDYGPGEHEWLALDLATKLLAKEESDASLQMAERERLWAEVICPAVSTRDAFRPDRIQLTNVGTTYFNPSGWTL